MSQAWLGHVAAHAHAPCRRAPARATGPRVAASPTVSRAQPAVSWPCRNLSRDITQRPSRPPVTIRPFVLRHNPPAARPSHACRLPLRPGPSCRRASRPCRRPSPRPYRGPIRSCPSRIVGVAATPFLLCHDTMHCIVTNAWKWAIAHPIARKIFFFSHHFFFHLFTYWKTTKKKYIFFSFFQ